MSEQDRAKPWDKLLKEQYGTASGPGAGDNPARGRSGVDWSDPEVRDAVVEIVRRWWEEQHEAGFKGPWDERLQIELSRLLSRWVRLHNLRWERKRERQSESAGAPPSPPTEASECATEGGDGPDGPGQGAGYGDGGYGQSGGFGGPLEGG